MARAYNRDGVVMTDLPKGMYRELRGHNVETGTIIVYRHDATNQVAEEEAKEVAGLIKDANPHWEGPFLVMSTEEALESMNPYQAYELYQRLHKVFSKLGPPTAVDSADAPAADSATVDSDNSGDDPDERRDDAVPDLAEGSTD